MTLSLNPAYIEDFRRVKYIQVGGMRFCKGPCKSTRSLGQFDGESTICKRCVLRTPK